MCVRLHVRVRLCACVRWLSYVVRLVCDRLSCVVRLVCDTLSQVDPSGAYFGWRASALGTNHVNAVTFLERRYSEDMELEDAIHTALLTLREGFEGEMTASNIEIGIVGKDRKFRVLTAAEVRDYLEEAD